MDSLATVRHHSDEYEDMILPSPHEDESEIAVRGYIIREPCPADYLDSVTVPFFLPVATHSTGNSIAVVFENVRRAPVAYFRFASVAGFLFFAFSLVFYRAFGTILFNPPLAVFGALGALLTVFLVEASLLAEKNAAKKVERGFHS